MPDSQKSVLMIAFHYPPDHSSSGFLRTLKFSKYLPECGWRPIVLTVREEEYESRDASFLSQIPAQAVVRRTKAINTKKSLSIKGKYLQVLATPDRYIGWSVFAVPAGRSLIRRYGVRAIYSTSPLATTHLIASMLKSLSGLPWIADFRDPWTEPEIAQKRSGLVFRLDSMLERGVLHKADRLLFTTAQLRDYVLGHTRRDLRAKTVVIPNGYDEEDFCHLPKYIPSALPVRIIHTGLVDESYRSPLAFLKVLSGLLGNDFSREQIRVEFLGGGSYVESSRFRSVLQQLKLVDVVNISGRLSYSECLQRQLQSHILLLLQTGDDTRTLIPAKAFEYLRIGRPILAVVPESASSELFQDVGGARIVHPLDHNGMKTAIRGMVRDALAGRWASSVDLSGLQAYSRQRLALRLGQEFDHLIAHPEATRN